MQTETKIVSLNAIGNWIIGTINGMLRSGAGSSDLITCICIIPLFICRDTYR